LLRKYEYQYQQRLRHESVEEEYENRTGKKLRRREDTQDHWHCPFFRYCWDSGMNRLPTMEDYPECKPRAREGESSVF
jgi:gentisate 1,2-dioxygenase